MQKRQWSVWETIAQNVIGQITAAIILYFWIGPNVAHNLILQLIFLVTALARGYAVRRLFNHLSEKSDARP